MNTIIAKIRWSALAALFILAACASPQKLLDEGRYDEAVTKSVKKLSGKKNKKIKHVDALEEAFARITKVDMKRIEVLKKEGREENWVEINRLHQDIRRRQELIEPLLPLYDKDGRKADFKFVKIEEQEIESKEKSADFYYGEGRRLLAEAEKGDKAAARKAYDQFENIRRYYKNYKDEDKWKKRAKELGVVHVLFKMENRSGAILPFEFERELKRMSVRDLESEWRSFHLNPESGFDYDYTVFFKITQLAVTADHLKEREYVDDKTITEGWEYVLDGNGNVVKDSSGNDVKVPKKVIIRARVFEVNQHKEAHVEGRLEYFDNREKDLIHTEPIAVDAIFDNYAAKYEGDKRALSEESKQRIGNSPKPFPSSEGLILQAVESLKPVLKEKISRSRVMI